MTGDRTAAGLFWEEAAGDYLSRKGLTILLKRYRCRLGEIDLVCADGATLVIVEIRARRGGAMVNAAESVDARKRNRIVKAARHLLMCKPAWQHRPVRFDVIAIDGIDAEAPRYTWIKAAFDAA